MRVLIDIVHMADVNFYKNAIKELKENGHRPIITARPRCNLIDVIKKEIDAPLFIIGKHYSSKIGKIFGLITRDLKLYLFLKKHKPDVVTGFGSFYIAMAAKWAGIRSVIFYDDPEYKEVYSLCKKYATTFIIPKSADDSGKNVVKGFDYKELAYLHPKYFKPNKRALKKYGLKAKEYIFIREVDSISLNYKSLNTNLMEIITKLKKPNLQIVLSLENKSLTNRYTDKSILLEEPVEDIYSLIYFAKYVISSGDTVAREAALLGVPTLYTGKREMEVNQQLISDGPIVTDIKHLVDNKFKSNSSAYKWVDTTKVIMENILK